MNLKGMCKLTGLVVEHESGDEPLNPKIFIEAEVPGMTLRIDDYEFEKAEEFGMIDDLFDAGDLEKIEAFRRRHLYGDD